MLRARGNVNREDASSRNPSLVDAIDVLRRSPVMDAADRNPNSRARVGLRVVAYFTEGGLLNDWFHQMAIFEQKGWWFQ